MRVVLFTPPSLSTPLALYGGDCDRLQRVLTHTLNYLFLHFAVTHLKLCVRVCVLAMFFNTLGKQRYAGFGLLQQRPKKTKNRDRSLYLHNFALALSHFRSFGLALSLFLSHTVVLPIPVSLVVHSRWLAFLFKTCKLFAFCLIPYTYAHKLSWVYVLNFTSHVWPWTDALWVRVATASLVSCSVWPL